MKKEISERHARALIPLKDSGTANCNLFQEVVENQFNVKQLETRIKEMLNPEEEKQKKKDSLKKKIG